MVKMLWFGTGVGGNHVDSTRSLPAMTLFHSVSIPVILMQTVGSLNSNVLPRCANLKMFVKAGFNDAQFFSLEDVKVLC